MSARGVSTGGREQRRERGDGVCWLACDVSERQKRGLFHTTAIHRRTSNWGHVIGVELCSLTEAQRPAPARRGDPSNPEAAVVPAERQMAVSLRGSPFAGEGPPIERPPLFRARIPSRRESSHRAERALLPPG